MSLQEETLDIETPENVAFGYQVAGIGSRFLAAFIDSLLIVLLQVVVSLVVFGTLALMDNTGLQETLGGWVVASFGLLAFIFFWGYYIFFEMFWNGQTPGKRWVGLRVIRGDGTPITLSESLIRNLTRILDLLPVAYGIGAITMFIDKQSRRLGDLAAGTLVVHDRAPISIQALSAKRSVTMARGRLVPLQGFPLERLTNNDLNLIEDFLQRRDQLMHHELLASQIVSTLHTRLGLPPPSISQPEAEDMLFTILQAVHKRQPDEDGSSYDNDTNRNE